MTRYRKGSHTLTRLTVHIVWVTKYRYHVLTGDIQSKCRSILIQDCETLEIEILKGVVSKDHVHMGAIGFCPPSKIKKIKERKH
jgi:putative transposase